MSRTYSFELPDIFCISCVRSIKTALLESMQVEIESCYVDLTTKKITLLVRDAGKEPSEVRELLRSIIKDTGFRCDDIESISENIQRGDKDDEQEKNRAKSWLKVLQEFISSHWFLGAIGIGSGLTLLILSLIFTGGFPLAAMISIGAVSSLLTLILGAPFYYSAAKKLVKARALTMDFLFAISTLTVIAVSVTAFFVPWLPMMFEAGLLIFGFRHLGVAIEDSLKIKVAGKSFQDRLPAKVEVLIDEEQMESRELAAIKVDDVLLLHADDLIPVDGICLDEESLVYDSIDSGAIIPRRIKRGERLLAGMRLAEGAASFRLQVTAIAADSYLARLDANIIQALSKQSPIEDISEKIMLPFILTVLALAIIAAVLTSIFFPPALAIQCLVLILVSACPCILGTIPSLAMKIGINKAVEYDVQFKSSEALQAAAATNAVVFDVNGTLTKGCPEGCRHNNNQELIAEEEMLRYFAAMEQKYSLILGKNTHPIANAIIDYVNKKIRMDSLPLVEELDQSNHSGLTAKIDGYAITLGNQTMMQEQGIDLTSVHNNLELQGGESVVYLARNRQLVGYIILTDSLRKDAKQTIDALKKMGKEIHICTGADEATAHRYATMLGIPLTNVRAACVGMAKDVSDNSKIAYIKSLKANGLKVAMVGDGGNDALAFKECDVSLAMQSRSGDEMAGFHADVLILNQSLLPVANAFAIASQTVTNIMQNLIFSLSYNVGVELVIAGLLVGLGFVLNPAVGVVLMIVQATLVLGNAYRFKRQSLDHLKPADAEEESLHEGSYTGLHSRMNVKTLAPASELSFEEQPCTVTLFSKRPLVKEKPREKGMELVS